jgi:protein SCO1/2
MKRLIRSGAAVASLLVAGSLLAAVPPAAAAPAGTNAPRWGAGYFPNVTLTTQDNKQVKFYDDVLKGKKVAIYLMYTTCKYGCPLETARLAQVQRYLGDRVGKEIYFYSITIDPKHDTPEVLKEYAEKYHAGPGWTFLTGNKADIDLISKKLGLFSETDKDNADGHTPILMIGNVATGQWMSNSALDNPKFLSLMIGQYLDSWKNGNSVMSKSYEQAGDINFDRGLYVFASKCSACHTIGKGDKIGPDLLGVTHRRDAAWLKHYVSKPDEVLASGDPIATALFKQFKEVRMPNLALDEPELQAVTQFLDRKVLHYACPMHPGETSDKAGKCGKCGMPLEPVFADNRPAATTTRAGAASAEGSNVAR